MNPMEWVMAAEMFSEEERARKKMADRPLAEVLDTSKAKVFLDINGDIIIRTKSEPLPGWLKAEDVERGLGEIISELTMMLRSGEHDERKTYNWCEGYRRGLRDASQLVVKLERKWFG